MTAPIFCNNRSDGGFHEILPNILIYVVLLIWNKVTDSQITLYSIMHNFWVGSVSADSLAPIFSGPALRELRRVDLVTIVNEYLVITLPE